MVCISAFGLCSCSSNKKSIIGTWSNVEMGGDIVSFVFTDDNTARRNFKSHFDSSDNTSEEYKWEVYSKYTYTNNDGEKTTYKPTDRYEGVLVLTYKDYDTIYNIFYYRFDENKERLYLAKTNDNKSEISYTRE